jgi:hypothetical protein
MQNMLIEQAYINALLADVLVNDDSLIQGLAK